MDLFYFFFHLALIIGKSKSITAFITTNYYITATGGLTLRKYLKENATILNLINFNQLKIFESAEGQHNLITIFQKGLNQNIKTKTIQTKRTGTAKFNILKNILNGEDQEATYQEISYDKLFDGKECYIRLGSEGNKIDRGIIEAILGKVAKFGTELGAICNVNNGIFAGADNLSEKKKEKYKILDANIGDGIFILKNEEIEKVSVNKIERAVVKPLFKNSDIYKYLTNNNNGLNIFNLRYADRPDINKYPNIYKYLSKFKELLLDRPRTGTLESAFNNGYWYVMSTSRRLNFENQKIVCPQRSKTNTFGYNEIPWYASADVYFITQKKSQNDNIVELKYILALLNSKLYYHWFYHKGKRKGEMLELYQKPLSEVPIKIISKTDQAPFIAIVDEILAITNKPDYNPSFPPARQKELEAQIDDMVCNLYQLDDEEKRVVLGG